MNAGEEVSQGPKFVVDDDWKAQAQAEKAALQKAREEAQKTPTAARPVAADHVAADVVASEAPSKSDVASDEKLIDFPPASLALLVSELGTQAIMALEESGASQGNKRANLLGIARHAIDTLEVLETKCHGNLSDEEALILSRYLQATRLAYVQVFGRKE